MMDAGRPKVPHDEETGEASALLDSREQEEKTKTKAKAKVEKTFTLNPKDGESELAGVALEATDFVTKELRDFGVPLATGSEFSFRTIQEILRDAADRKFDSTTSSPTDPLKLKIVVKEKEDKIAVNFRDDGVPFRLKDGIASVEKFVKYDDIQFVESKKQPNAFSGRGDKEGKVAYDAVKDQGGVVDFRNRSHAIKGGTVRVLFNKPKAKTADSAGKPSSSVWCFKPRT